MRDLRAKYAQATSRTTVGGTPSPAAPVPAAAVPAAVAVPAAAPAPKPEE